MVTRHWSGKHRAVVQGINLVSLLWTDGDRHIPCDYRLSDKATDGLTKNDHFAAMLRTAKERGLAPDCVASDGWYSGLDNLKLIRGLGWRWLTRLKVNRRVNLDRQGNKAVGATAIDSGGTIVHLEGYGLIRVFRIVSRDGHTEHWATDDLAMDDLNRGAWRAERGDRGIQPGPEQCAAWTVQARCGRGIGNTSERSGRSCVWSDISTPPGEVVEAKAGSSEGVPRYIVTADGLS